MKKFSDYEGLYKVTDEYRVMSIGTGQNRRTGQYNKVFLHGAGNYPAVQFSKGKVQKKMYMHRIIAELFVPNPDNKPQVNHIDGNKLNWHPSNLEWCTASENSLHASRNNLLNPPTKLVLDIKSGIFYKSLVEACNARCLNPTRVATQIYRKRNFSGLEYV